MPPVFGINFGAFCLRFGANLYFFVFWNQLYIVYVGEMEPVAFAQFLTCIKVTDV